MHGPPEGEAHDEGTGLRDGHGRRGQNEVARLDGDRGGDTRLGGQIRLHGPVRQRRVSRCGGSAGAPPETSRLRSRTRAEGALTRAAGLGRQEHAHAAAESSAATTPRQRALPRTTMRFVLLDVRRLRPAVDDARDRTCPRASFRFRDGIFASTTAAAPTVRPRRQLGVTLPPLLRGSTTRRVIKSASTCSRCTTVRQFTETTRCMGHAAPIDSWHTDGRPGRNAAAGVPGKVSHLP
jgi:hypothetical protein